MQITTQEKYYIENEEVRTHGVAFTSEEEVVRLYLSTDQGTAFITDRYNDVLFKLRITNDETISLDYIKEDG